MLPRYRRLFSLITLFFVIQLQFFQNGVVILQKDLPAYAEEAPVDATPTGYIGPFLDSIVESSQPPVTDESPEPTSEESVPSNDELSESLESDPVVPESTPVEEAIDQETSPIESTNTGLGNTGATSGFIIEPIFPVDDSDIIQPPLAEDIVVSDKVIDETLEVVEPTSVPYIDELGRIDPYGFDSVYTKGGDQTTTYCSLITRTNLENILQVGGRKDPSKYIEQGDAVTLLQVGKDNDQLVQVTKNDLVSTLQKLYDENQFTVFDIYTYRPNSTESEINKGHRFVAILGIDDSWFAIDPLRGNKSIDAQLLQDYIAGYADDEEIYIRKVGFNPVVLTKEISVESGFVLESGGISVLIPEGTIITKEDQGGDSTFEDVNDFAIQENVAIDEKTLLPVIFDKESKLLESLENIDVSNKFEAVLVDPVPISDPVIEQPSVSSSNQPTSNPTQIDVGVEQVIPLEIVEVDVIVTPLVDPIIVDQEETQYQSINTDAGINIQTGDISTGSTGVIIDSGLNQIEQILGNNNLINNTENQSDTIVPTEQVLEENTEIPLDQENTESYGTSSLEPNTVEAFQLGDMNSHLKFSKPIRIRIDTLMLEGTTVGIEVLHEGDVEYGTVGITMNQDATCIDGVSSDEISTTSVQDGVIQFYTCGASSFIVNTALSTGNIRFWFRADTGTNTQVQGNAVTTWNNFTGVAINPTQGIAANRPIYNVGSGGVSGLKYNMPLFNFNPYLVFDGSNDRLSGASINIGRAQIGLSIFMVSMYTAGTGTAFGFTRTTASEQVKISLQGSGDQIIASGTTAGTGNRFRITPQIGIPGIRTLVAQHTGTSSYGRYNGSGYQMGTGLIASNTVNTVIGGSAAQNAFFSGGIAEIIIYSGLASLTTTNKIESYLATKYGISLDQTTKQNYVHSNSGVYWSGVQNSGYNFNITMIARDDAFGLTQKQSKSVNTSGLVILSLGSLALTNTGNGSSFSQNFTSYGFGDDNGSIATWQGVGAPVGGYAIIQRKWKIQYSGDASDINNVRFYVPESANELSTELPAVGGGTGEIFMVVDADGDFSNGSTIYTGSYTGTLWEFDVNVANGSYFTFATRAGFTITQPGSGQMFNTQYPWISGTGTTDGSIVNLTYGTGGATIGTAVVANGMWTVVPTSPGISLGTNQICVNSGSSCITITITGYVSLSGILDDTFTGEFASDEVFPVVYDSVLQKIMVGGWFGGPAGFNNQTAEHNARLTLTGLTDNTFTGLGGGLSYTIVKQSDGKYLIGGDFNNYNGINRGSLARITSTGALDPTFTGLGTTGSIRSIVIQPDGMILVGGGFSIFNGVTVGGIVRLTNTGALDPTFNVGGSGANEFVWNITLQQNGNIVIGGDFTDFNGVTRTRIAGLTITGVLTNDFAGAGFDGSAWNVAQQSDGKLVVGGAFGQHNGVARNNVARITSTGLLDSTFTGSFADDVVRRITLQPDGGMLVAGDFTTFNGIPKLRLVRLTSTGLVDHSLTGGTVNNYIRDIVIQPHDSKILIGGWFTGYNGVTRNHVARFGSDVVPSTLKTIKYSFKPNASPSITGWEKVSHPTDNASLAAVVVTTGGWTLSTVPSLWQPFFGVTAFINNGQITGDNGLRLRPYGSGVLYNPYGLFYYGQPMAPNMDAELYFTGMYYPTYFGTSTNVFDTGVLTSNWFTDTSFNPYGPPAANIILTGLNTGKVYNFRIAGSVDEGTLGGYNASTVYAVGDVNNNSLVSTKGNTSHYAIFSNVSPNASGEIAIWANASWTLGGPGMLGGIEVIESTSNDVPYINLGSGEIRIYSPATGLTLSGVITVTGGATITEYRWNQVKGPSEVVISSGTSLTALVTGMTKLGVYEFELRVKASNGIENKKTVRVVLDSGKWLIGNIPNSNGGINGGRDMGYLYNLPDDYNAPSCIQKKYPAIIYLHGFGQNGTDTEMLKGEGLGYLVDKGELTLAFTGASGEIEKYIAFMPQTSVGGPWGNDEIQLIIDRALSGSQYRVDYNRVYIVGFSYGSYGLWNYLGAAGKARAFAAAVPSAFVPVYNPGYCNVGGSGLDIFAMSEADMYYGSYTSSPTEFTAFMTGLQSCSPALNPQVIGQIMTGRNHVQMYHFYWKPDYTGFEGKNIYNWLLDHSNNQSSGGAGQSCGPFALNYSGGIGGTISGVASQYVSSGATGTYIQAIPASGYTFSGWSDGRTDNPRIDGNVTGHVNVVAYFTIIAYTLTYTGSTGGTISGTAIQSVDYNNTGTLVQAVANTGYTFSGWSDGTTGITRQDLVTGNKTITAYFTINTYTLTYTGSTGGTISGTAIQNVDYNNTGTLVQAVANTGYTFSGWSDGTTGITRQDLVTGNKTITAYFTINTYTLTYTGSTGGTISGTAIQNVNYNNTGTLVQAVANTGYTFSGWSDGTTGITRQDLVTGNKTITAYFTINTYTLTYTGSTGGTISGTAIQNVNYNNTGTLVQAVANTGYTFSGWSDGTTGIARQDLVTGNKTITAYFTINTYTLTYTGSTGGTISGTSVQSVNYNNTGTLVQAVANTGYTFSGWSDGTTGITRQDLVTGNKTITAYFTINTYTLTYTGSTGGTISGTAIQSVNYNNTGTLVQAVANTGYTFSGWADGTTGITRQDLVTGNKTITAYFTINTYTLTYTGSTGGTISGTAIQSVNYNNTGTLVAAVANTGYTFSGWSDGTTGITRQDLVTGNKTITAYFTINMYTLTYTGSTGGTISGTSVQSVDYNNTGTLVQAVANTGYTFSGWSDGSTGSTRQDLVTGNKTITAYFTINTYTLTYTGSTGGTISGTAVQAVDYNNTGTLVQAVANTGYTFSGWSDGTTGITRQDLVTGNKTITAYFTINTYTLTYTGSTGGTISGTAVQAVDYNNTGTLVQAVANIGYTFSGWSDGTTGITRQDLVTGNKTLTAYFTINTYTLTYTGSTGGTISGTSVQNVDYNNTGTLVQAVANTGYTFSGWSDGTTGITRQDLVTGNKTITAYFTINTYTLTYTGSTGGTISGTAIQNINYNNTGTLVQAVANTGYLFSGWSDGTTGITRQDLVTGNKTITAYFTINTYTLTYTGSTGGTISGTAIQSVDYNNTGTLVQAVANTGYTFSGWSDGTTGITRQDLVTGNKTITAYFTINTYTLTYTGSTGGTISGTSVQLVDYNNTGTLVQAVANTGYTFSGWSDGSTGITRQDLVTGNKTITAYFTINTYTLTYTGSTGGTISGTAVQAVDYNNTGTLVQAVANTGYTFSGWSDGSTGITRQDLVTGNKTITAYFTINTYTLTYTGSTGGTISGTAIQNINYNNTGTLVQAVADSGYTFVGWSDGYTGITRQDLVTGNKTITAQFGINTYVLAYATTTGGIISGSTTQFIDFGNTGTLVQAVANTGYTFSGWSDGSTGITRQDLVTGNKTITAYFTINTYTLTYTGSTGGTISGTAIQSVDYNNTGTLVQAVANTGYTFSGWSDGTTGITRQDLVTGNKTITAYFTINTYTLTYTGSTGGTISGTAIQSVDYNNTGTLVQAVANTGYTFSGWSDGSTGITRQDLVTGNKTITAYFTINTYTLTYTGSTGGTISGTSVQLVDYNNTGTLVQAVANTGYTFSGWSDGSTGITRQDLVTGNKTITAYFTINTYTLTYTGSTGGTISGTAIQNINYNNTGTLVQAVANTGYTFSGWSDGTTGITRQDLVTGNKTIIAYFTINTYMLTFTTSGGGVLSGNTNQPLVYLATGTLVEAIANTGYTFSGWSDGSTQNPRLYGLITGNRVLTGIFNINYYQVTYTGSSGGSVTGNLNQSIAYMSTGVAVTAIANTGYTFSGWSDGYTGATRTDGGITGARGYTAYFTINTYTLTYTGSTGGTISGTAIQNIDYNNTGTLVQAVANTGYTFSGWSDGTTGITRQDLVTGNKTITALFRVNVFTLTYTGSTGGTISGTAIQALNYNATGTIVTARANTGYTFSGWSDGTTGITRQDLVTGNKTITAYFTINTYTLQFNPSTGGVMSGTTTQFITYLGTGVGVQAIADTGYTFSGWSDGSIQNPRIFGGITGNRILTGIFTLNIYTLTYTGSTGGTISGTAIQAVNYNATGTIVTARANTGYTFSGWSDGIVSNPRQDSNITGNRTYTAQFRINTYTITYTTGIGGYLSGNNIQNIQYLNTGSSIQAIANTGYTFSGWSDGFTGAMRTDGGITGNRSFTAQFTINTYTIQYVTATSGSFSGSTTQFIQYLNTGTFIEAVADSGYSFLSWSDGSEQNPRRDGGVTGNRIITGEFVLTYLLPIVTLNGTGNMTLTRGSTFNEPGAEWIDYTDGSGSILAATSGTINTNLIGVYNLEYAFTNSFGYTRKVTRRITVIAPTNGGGGGGGGGSFGGGTGTVNTGVISTGVVATGVVNTGTVTTGVVNTGGVRPITGTFVVINPTTVTGAMLSAMTQTTAIQPGQQVIVPTQPNTALTSTKCYNPKEFSYITLGKEQVEKDMIVYQGLLHAYGLTRFTDTDSYRPANGLRRNEAAKMFVEFARNILCRQKSTTYNNQYSDIADTDTTLQPFIIAAYEYGIMKGSNGKFRPTDIITRQEFVAALIRMFVNKYLEEPNKDWFENYEYVFANYGLDTILSINDDTDRYDVSKIFYKLYYDKNYTWTDAGYVLAIENSTSPIKPITPAPETPIIPPIIPIDITTPLEPIVTIPLVPINPTIASVIVTASNMLQGSVLQSAQLQSDVIQVGQVAQVVIEKNNLLEIQKTCYTPPKYVTVTLGNEQVEKDLVLYQGLLHSYGLTKFNDTDSYKPQNGLKRYEAAKMFVEFARNILCRQKKTQYNNQYTDIENVDPTLKPYIIEAYEYGIMKGSNTLFRPTDNITHKEFIAILIRMFTNQNLDITGQGNDWDVAYKQVYQRYELDSIVGFGGQIDRYDISKILYQLYFDQHYMWTNAGYVLPQNK